MKALKFIGAVLFFTGLFVIAGYAETESMTYVWTGLGIVALGLINLLFGTKMIYVKGCKK